MDALGAWLEARGPRQAFEVLCDLLPEAAVFIVDAEREIVHWSRGAEALLGFSADEAVGRLCLNAIRCRTCTLGCGLTRHGRIEGVDLDHYRADELWVPTKKYARGFFDDDGAFLGGIEILLPVGPPRHEEGAPSELAGLPPGAESFHGLVSRDEGMRRAFQVIRNVSETLATVLVHGESGTGKELVARAIHQESPRSQGPFIAVNCAALTPGLVESELFGHVRGAFTGAVRDRKGVFEQANGGTLFLDEVAELPIEMQSKLLRVLEDRTVTPVGASLSREIDVRIVAATHRTLAEEVAAGRFREDLMYRLRVVPITIPPLRERRSDVDVLTRTFVDRFNAVGPRRVTRIAPEATRALLDHDWPGNVRELRNVLEYAFAVARSDEIGLDELPPELLGSVTAGLVGRSAAGSEAHGHDPDTAAAERERIRAALQLEGGRVGAAAARLGMSRATFWRHRRRLGL